MRLRMIRTTGVVVLGLLGAACSPPSGAPTRLDITTIQTICGGVFNPDEPPCRSGPEPRSVEISSGRTVIASGTTGSDGTLLLDVPAGHLVVSVPGALPYMNCDAIEVLAAAGRTTSVTQTCTLLLP